MKNSVKEFLNRNSINLDVKINPYVIEAIDTLKLTYKLVNDISFENVTQLEKEPVWSVMYDSFTRAYDYTEASLALFIISHISSAEALCRTSVEASVNLYYLSVGDDVENVISYFKNHIQIERKQNKTWHQSVTTSNHPLEAKQKHFELIEGKEKALGKYEIMLKESFSLANINYDSIDKKWPSIFDRFKAIEKEIDYRTLYAALCSQAHNDPEDSLNNFMGRVTLIENLENGIEMEKYLFSLDMILCSIQLLTEASTIFVSKYTSNKMTSQQHEKLLDMFKKATMNIMKLSENREMHMENIMK